MAMLAEPRRKEKWTLNPRGKFWSDDKNKFGQRMLEKMGWSEGKGLGASEQGATTHVAVKVKNDSKGLGSSIKDGEWCRHQEEFENLLANLNDSADVEGSASSLTSLEEISKNSKKRLHYSKFTRGKDLTLYSKKDLDCILGIGVRKEEKPSKDDLVEDVGSMDTMYGVTTIVGGSLDDYFKKKMPSLSKSYNIDNSIDIDDESLIKTDRKRKSDIKDAELMDICNNGEGEASEGDNAENHNKQKKKKMKEKFKNNLDVEQDMLLEDANQGSKNNGIEGTVLDSAPCGLSEDLKFQDVQKKKKRKKVNVIEENVEEEIRVSEEGDWKVREKKKKKSISVVGDLQASDTLIAKEKRRKKRSKSGDESEMQNTPEEGSQSVERLQEISCLDGCKRLQDSVEEVQILQEEDVQEVIELVTKEVKSNLCDDSVKPEGRPLKKKCKKKRRNKVESEELMCIKEIYVVKDDDDSEKVVESPAFIKSKKRKEKGPSKEKHLESSDDIIQIIEVNEDLETQKNGTGSFLDGNDVDFKERKRKEKKKKRLSNTDDSIDTKLEDNFCDTLQSKPKKSKKSNGKKSSVTEMKSCDKSPTENGVQGDSMLITNSADIGKEDPLVEQLSNKCKGEIFSEAIKQGGETHEISYYSCLKKKEKKCVVSDVLHVFKGANLKDIIGYDAEMNKKE